MKPLLAALLFTSCAVAPKPRSDVPVLAPVPSPHIEVQFVGTAYDPERLYVCDSYQGKLSCVEFGYFMEHLGRETK